MFENCKFYNPTFFGAENYHKSIIYGPVKKFIAKAKPPNEYPIFAWNFSTKGNLLGGKKIRLAQYSLI